MFSFMSVWKFIFGMQVHWPYLDKFEYQGHLVKVMRKYHNFTYFNLLFLYIYLQVINKVKVTHQGEGHIKVKEKYLCPFQFLYGPYCQQAGGLHLT